jgi:hypothetical protein
MMALWQFFQTVFVFVKDKDEKSKRCGCAVLTFLRSFQATSIQPLLFFFFFFFFLFVIAT